MDEPSLKTLAGRLREAGARAILNDRFPKGGGTGMTYQDIAEKHGVSIGTVFNVCKFRTWSFLRQEYEAAGAA